MCGIIGYIGTRPCVDIIFNGLSKLEYRGYDSAGIATVQDDKIHVIKTEGKLAALKPSLENLPAEASVGLGHTRWATHGPPTTLNAHPHAVAEMAIVHNGIIENYQDLKAGLHAGGVDIVSETDTEIVLHLLCREYNELKDMKEAILSLISKLKGAYSLGIVNPKEPDAIYLVKQGSPLVIGLGKEENLFASDVAALASHTKENIILQDGQFARITASDVTMWNFSGDEIKPDVKVLDWTEDAIEKGGYPHYMLKEIHEQPAILAKLSSSLINLETGEFNEAEVGLDKLNIDRIKRVDIVACGTAYLSGVIGRYLIERLCKIPCQVETASEYRYREPFIDGDTLFMAVSQSGETADTLAALKLAKEQGAQVHSICNVLHSEIPRLSDATLHIKCGPEIGVASTKALTAMIMGHFAFASNLAQKLGRLDENEYKSALQDIKALPHHIQTVLDDAERINKIAHEYCEVSHFLYIGRGENFAVAYEGALKLKEISYIHAEAYGAGELKHGPIALVDQFMPIVAIAPKDRYYDKTISNIEEVKARKGRIIGVGAKDDSQLKNLCDHTLPCPQVSNPTIQAIINVIPLQLFSYYVALLRGTDVDQPRNLAKSVTVE